MTNVRPVSDSSQFKDFVGLPWKIYEGDKSWVPPLRVMVKEMLDEKKNPYYRHASKKLFVAYDQSGRVVGRVAGFYDADHNKYHNEKTSFFGFFESVNNPETAKALIDEVKKWALEQGATKLRGPINLNTNYESGLLIDGFDDTPWVGMTYGPRYYQKLLESCGFYKAKDLYAYYCYLGDQVPEKAMKHMQRIKKRYNIKLRYINMSKYDEEIESAFEVYNSAWEQNWGFIPMDRVEFMYRAKEMKAVMDPELVYIAEVDGKTAGFSLAMPDSNLIFKKIPSGKLLPTGLLKLLWYAKGPKKRQIMNRFRIIALGVRPEYQHLGLGPVLYSEYFNVGNRVGYAAGECSWILEDNQLMIRALELMGAKRLKTYRIYDMDLG